MTKEIKVEGMSCGHCKMAVEKAAGEIQGVQKAEVSLENGLLNVVIDSESTIEAVKQAVTDTGYTVLG